MKTKKYIIPILILFFCVNLSAQKKRKPDPERVKAFKIAYITDKLDLTSKEAEKFWPEYNQHEKMMAELRQQENSTIKKYVKEKEDIDGISEQDAKEIVTSVRNIRKKMDDLNLKFLDRMQKILPYKKILKLQIAEREFKRKLLENLRKRRRKLQEERK